MFPNGMALESEKTSKVVDDALQPFNLFGFQ